LTAFDVQRLRRTGRDIDVAVKHHIGQPETVRENFIKTRRSVGSGGSAFGQVFERAK
jgi:hypothetical protein